MTTVIAHELDLKLEPPLGAFALASLYFALDYRPGRSAARLNLPGSK